MLSIVDPKSGQGARFCDGLSRRDMLRIGTLSVGGLSLPQILAAEQASGHRTH